MPAAERWQFEWRRNWRDVWAPAFEQAWQAMFDASEWSHAYHRPALVRAWAATCGRAAGAEPLFGLGRSTSGVQVMLPWVVVRYPGRIAVRRVLEPAGGDIFGYHDPLVLGARPQEIDWAAFWRAVRVESGSACDQALFRFLRPAYAPEIEWRLASEDSPILNLHGHSGLETVLAACSSNHRVDVRRRLRRLRERGEVSLWIAGADEATTARDAVRAGMLPAYRALWEGRDRRNTLLRAGFEQFLDAVVDQGVQGRWAQLSVLRVAGAPIAWHVGFAHRGRLYWWLPAHDRTWSPHSPGKALLALLIDALCRERWAELHFLIGSHDYKAAWKPTQQRLAAIGWTAPTLRGRLIAWYDAWKQAS